MPPKYDSQTRAIRQLQELVPQKGLLHSSIVGLYTEGRIFQRIEHNVFVIRSAESAPADGCILIIGPQIDVTSNTDKLMQILDWCEAGEPFEIMTFDIKSAQVLCTSRGHVIRFNIAFELKPKQTANCSFHIVVMKENSQYVALLSPEVLIRKEHLGKEQVSVIGYQVPRQLVQFIDYMPNAIPWTIHIDELSEALQNLRDQRSQGLPLSVKGIPLMTKGKTSASTRLITHRATELGVIRFLHKTFKSHARLQLSLHLLDIQPLFGDFWVHQQGFSRALVELKGTTEHSLYRRQGGWVEHVSFQNYRTTSIFHVARPWDHLLSYNHALQEFYFIPFDFVPRHWRNVTVRAKSNDLGKEYVKAPQKDLEQFRLSLRDAGWLEKFVKILQSRRSPPNQYDVSALYTGGDGDAGEVADLQNSVDDGNTPATERIAERPESSVVDETDEGMFLSSAFLSEVMEKLMHDCAISMTGLVFYLGRFHPIADLVFVQYSWTTKEQKAYLSSRRMPMHIAELTDTTRVVLLSAFHSADAMVSAGGLTTTASNPHRYFRQLPAILLLATGKELRKPTQDEPVNFLPLGELLTPKDWTTTKTDEVRKFHNRQKYYRQNNPKLEFGRGVPVTHSVRLSEVHRKMLQIIKGRGDFQIGIDPAQVYASKPYLHAWKQVKMLHATNIYANINAD